MTDVLQALKEAQQRLRGAGMLGGPDDAINVALTNSSGQEFAALEAAYVRGAAWACALGGAVGYSEIRKAARDYADRMSPPQPESETP